MSSARGRRQDGESLGRKSIITAAQISLAPQSLHHPPLPPPTRALHGEVTDCDTIARDPHPFFRDGSVPGGAWGGGGVGTRSTGQRKERTENGSRWTISEKTCGVSGVNEQSGVVLTMMIKVAGPMKLQMK